MVKSLSKRRFSNAASAPPCSFASSSSTPFFMIRLPWKLCACAVRSYFCSLRHGIHNSMGAVCITSWYPQLNGGCVHYVMVSTTQWVLCALRHGIHNSMGAVCNTPWYPQLNGGCVHYVMVSTTQWGCVHYEPINRPLICLLKVDRACGRARSQLYAFSMHFPTAFGPFASYFICSEAGHGIFSQKKKTSAA